MKNNTYWKGHSRLERVVSMSFVWYAGVVQPSVFHLFPVLSQPANTPVQELRYTRMSAVEKFGQLAPHNIPLPLYSPKSKVIGRPHLEGKPYPAYLALQEDGLDREDLRFQHRFHTNKGFKDSSLLPWRGPSRDFPFRWIHSPDFISTTDEAILQELPQLQAVDGAPEVPKLSAIIALRKAALAMVHKSWHGINFCSGLPLSLAEDYRRHYALYVSMFPSAVVSRLGVNS